jgi:hypothetical protein
VGLASPFTSVILHSIGDAIGGGVAIPVDKWRDLAPVPSEPERPFRGFPSIFVRLPGREAL